MCALTRFFSSYFIIVGTKNIPKTSLYRGPLYKRFHRSPYNTLPARCISSLQKFSSEVQELFGKEGEKLKGLKPNVR